MIKFDGWEKETICPQCGKLVKITNGCNIYQCFNGEGHSFYNQKREDDIFITEIDIEKKQKG